MTHSESDNQHHKKRRKKFILASTLGIGLPLAWLLWGIFGWPQAIQISKETTWLTEPVGDDGYVDYMSYLYDRHAELSDTSIADDEWRELIEAERGSGPLAGSGMEYIEPSVEFKKQLPDELSEGERELRAREFTEETVLDLTRELWEPDSHPILANNIKANEKWFATVEATFPSTSSLGAPGKATLPIECGIAMIVLPGTEYSRTFSRRFLLRAAGRFGDGEVTAALDDVGFVYKIAQRDRCFIIEQSVGVGIEAEASRTLISGLLSSPQLTDDHILQISQLPQSSSSSQLRTAVEFERVMTLDSLCRMHKSRSPGSFLFSFSSVAEPQKHLLERRFCKSVEWDDVLRHENEFLDKVDAAIANEDWRAGHLQLEKLFAQMPMARAAESKITKATLLDPAPRTGDVKLGLLKFHEWIPQAHTLSAEKLLRRRVVQIVARLCVWKRQHDRWPDDLSAISNLEQFPESPSVFSDPFSNNDLLYTRTTDGFELKSVGINGQADQTGYLELKNRHADPLIETANDDRIWRWPNIVSEDAEN